MPKLCRAWTYAAASVIALVAQACAPHRTPAPTPVALPAPLVTAILEAGYPRGTPEYYVGVLPPEFPTALVPPGPVRILGGMTAGGDILVVFADSTRRLAAEFEKMFAGHGFARPKASPGSGFMQPSGPYSGFCSDSASVSADPLAGRNRDFVRVRFRRQPSGFGCPVFPSAPTSSDELTLPVLMPPASVHVMGSHRGSGGYGINSAAEMSGTSLVPSVILAHYAAQLVVAGWKASAPAISDRVAAQFFEARSASGAAWEGVMMATGGGSTLEISLNMHERGRR